jgi:hypothetical protein
MAAATPSLSRRRSTASRRAGAMARAATRDAVPSAEHDARGRRRRDDATDPRRDDATDRRRASDDAARARARARARATRDASARHAIGVEKSLTTKTARRWRDDACRDSNRSFGRCCG